MENEVKNKIVKSASDTEIQESELGKAGGKTLFITNKNSDKFSIFSLLNSLMQYANITDAFTCIEKTTDYVVQIPFKYKNEFDAGKVFINQNSKTGEMWPTLYKKLESGKREFVANLPIKKENLIQGNPLDRFANSCHNICMQQQIYNLTEAIEQTYRVVERIEQGQKDDRIGTLQAGRKHIILAMNQPPEDRAAAMELGRANMLCAQSQIFETFKRRVRAYEPIPDSMFLRIAREFRHSGYLSRRDKEFDEIQEYYDLYLQSTQLIAASYILCGLSEAAKQVYDMAKEEMEEVDFTNLKSLHYLHHMDQEMFYYHACEYIEAEKDVCLEGIQEYDSITVEITGEKLLEVFENAGKETI